jgi:tRNA pseudouridine13 synthase
LPSARQKPETGSEEYRIVEAVLHEEGITLAELKVPGLRKPFFSKGERAACVFPDRLHASAVDDELNPGSQKLQLTFELPRGSYATMLVKRITVPDPTGPTQVP